MATYTGIGFDATNAKIVKPTSSDTVSNAGNASIGGTLAVTGNASIGGNLTVTGDIISGGSTDVVIKDQMIDLGIGATAPQVTGFSFSVDQGTAATSFSAINSGTNRVTVTSSTGFSANDIIVINGSSDSANDGLFYIASVVDGTTIEISTTALTKAPFLQTAFASTTSGESSNQLAQVNLKVLAVADGTTLLDNGGSPFTAGTFVQAYYEDAISTDFTANGGYSKLVPDAVATSLQGAYNNGATITTASTTPIAFTLTSGGFNVIGGGAVDLGNTTALSSFNVDSSGAITLDGAGASNFTVAGANLTLATTTSGTLAVSSAGALDVDGSTLTIDSTDTTSMTMTANDSNPKVLTISAINSHVSGTAKLALQADDQLALIQNANEHLLASAGATTIKSFAGQALTILSNQNLDMDGTVVTLDGSSGVSIDGSGSASNFSSTGQNLTVSTITSGTLAVSSAGALDMDGVAVTLDGSNGVSIDGSGSASNFSSTGQNLTISTITSGTLSVTSAGALVIDGAATTLDSTTLSIDSTDTTNLTMTANANNTAKTMLVSALNNGTGSASAILQLNATAPTAVVKTTIGGNDKVLINNTSATFSDKLFATSGASFLSLTTDATGVSAGDLVAINASGNATKADADGSGTRNVIGFALETAGATSPVKIAQTGVVTGLPSLTAGTKYYMSATAGGLTDLPPSTSGSTVFQAGIAISSSSLAIQLQFIIENP
jgi:hypothetical protein